MNDNILCSVVIQNKIARKIIMTDIEKTAKILTKEMESLNESQLHELFVFYYKLNHQHANLISYDKFDEFLSSFDRNPFRLQKDKKFKDELIKNLIEYTDDQMSLLTAVLLLKQDFTIEEIIYNYYSNVNVFADDYF